MDISMMAYITIDVGGTYLKSAVLFNTAEVLPDSWYVTKSFSKDSKEKIIQAFFETVAHGLSCIEKKELILGGIGIAFPGPFNYENGIPLMEHKFMSIYGVNLREIIYGFPGVPFDIPIKFMHDANAVLAGELWIGKAVGHDNAAVVTLGTGLGFALSENGVIQCNSIGGPLVTIYSLPYRQGILEDYTAQRGFLNIYQRITGNAELGKIKVSDIGKWASEGDQDSIQTFREVGEILAESLENILIERNITCLLLGGQISRSFQYMDESLKLGLKNVKCLREISVVESIDNAALLGTLKNILGIRSLINSIK